MNIDAAYAFFAIFGMKRVHHRDHPRHFVVEFVDEGQRNRRQRRRKKKAGNR